MPPPRPYHQVYRSFAAIDFDPAKSEAVLQDIGFDPGYIAGAFPGYVIERKVQGATMNGVIR